MSPKTLYTAEASVTGGRLEGHGRTSDGALEVDLRVPAELGGPGDGTNPEQLFAVGYAACFENSLRTVARRKKIEVEHASVDSKVHLRPTEDRAFTLAVELHVTLRPAEHAAEITAIAHRVCPYSMATRGNIDVQIFANDEPLE